MALPDPVSAFGPFLIPAALFVLGAAGYLLLWLVTGRNRDPWRDERAERNPDERTSDRD